MAQLKTPQETEDVVLTSSVQANLHSLCQNTGGILCSNYRAEVLALLNATETISWEEKPNIAVFLTDSLSALQALMSGEPDTNAKEATENISTLAQTVLSFSGYQQTPALGEIMADQLAKGKRSNPYYICPTEKSKLLSVTRRKPPSTARLADTTQTRTHSISCHNTNRPSSFASEQATADWIAI